MRSIRSSGAKFAVAASAASFGLFIGGPARADFPLVKNDTWTVYTTGRLGGYFSFGTGDASPVARPGENIPAGAGLDVGSDTLPSAQNQQARFTSMRFRSGFVPNVLAFGVDRQVNDDFRARAYFALWATMETESQRKSTQVYADARETWMKLESNRWGTLTVGKALDLFSRGATENDFLYLHGYGLGFPGNINTLGPTSGMIGFGVLAAFFSAGITYTTPNLAGIQLTFGGYDPTTLPGFYEATRDPRWEAELTYNATWGPVKLHLFGNGGYQRFFKPASDASAAGYGAGYGGRIEVGPAHLGVAGHYGKGLGLQYAFQAVDVTVAPTFELRDFGGYSAFFQYVLWHFDLNAGYGSSTVYALDSDKNAMPNAISLPQQWAISAAVVYHATDFIHVDVDWLHAKTTWSLGEQQTMDFINAGTVVTW